NINQLQPRTLQANPGVNANFLRPYKGLGIIGMAENSGRSIYHGLQVGLERRFASASNSAVPILLPGPRATPLTYTNTFLMLMTIVLTGASPISIERMS